MTPPNRVHALRSAVLLLAVYLAARWAGWIGPGASVPLVPGLLWPAVVLTCVWGLWRLAGRGRA